MIYHIINYPIKGEKEEWTRYVERHIRFFTANDITEESKKQSVFVSVIVAYAYNMLGHLVLPENPGNKTYKDFLEIMGKHQNPMPWVIVQRCNSTVIFISRVSPFLPMYMYVAK